MKAWQLTYDVEQTSWDMPIGGGRSIPPGYRQPCNAMAPEHITICGHAFPSGTSFCQKVKDHPGGHSTKPSACNRPLGHEGPHAFIVLKDARKLGEWGAGQPTVD